MISKSVLAGWGVLGCVVLAGCASGGPAPSGGAPGVPSATKPPSATASAGAVPRYPGSQVKGFSDGATVLTAPEGVPSVAAFYRDGLTASGWRMTSVLMSQDRASIVATRGSEGLLIKIYRAPTGDGCEISVFYPVLG